MSKAVLVMDMPEKCSRCKFAYEFYGTKKCQLLNSLRPGVCSILMNENFAKKRDYFCPLRELPEKKETKDSYSVYSKQEVFAYQKGWREGREDGWNNCIDVITGGTECKNKF